MAYSLGIEGGGFGAGQGELRLVVLAPGGEKRFENVMPRRWSRVIHGFPVPQSKGVLLDEVHERVLMRIDPDGTSGEEWWLHALSTGERGDLKRCLVVCPGSLAEPWQDELHPGRRSSKSQGGRRFHILVRRSPKGEGGPFEILTPGAFHPSAMSRNDAPR